MPMLHSQSSNKDLLLEIQETFFYYLFSEERVALYLLFHSPPHKPWGTANVQSQGHLLGRVLPSGRAHFLLRRGLQERKSSLPPLLACSPHSCTCQNDTCLLGRAGQGRQAYPSGLRGRSRAPHLAKNPGPGHNPVLSQMCTWGSEGEDTGTCTAARSKWYFNSHPAAVFWEADSTATEYQPLGQGLEAQDRQQAA